MMMMMIDESKIKFEIGTIEIHINNVTEMEVEVSLKGQK